MPTFRDPTGPVDLPNGVRISAPGLRGTATYHPPAEPGTRAPGVESPTNALLDALAATEFEEQAVVTVDDLGVEDATGTDRSGAGGDDTLTLEVPDQGEDWAQVVLAVRGDGVLTWHLPEGTSTTGDSLRGDGDTTVFRIPVPEARPPIDDEAASATAEADDGTRGLIATAGGMLLKALVFPVARTAGGAIVRTVARGWEDRNRPHVLRWHGPAGDDRHGRELTAAEVASLADGPSLLFLHGTFSTASSGFGQMPDAMLQRMHHAYGGRVVAFDHPSLATSPQDNLAALQRALHGAPRIQADVITHSRGGLVGRLLAGGLAPVPELDVRTLVFGATPNHGTLLAHPDHVIEFIDRYTTLLNLFPPGPAEVVQAVLEAIATAVKALVVGGLDTLSGLTAMNPEGAFLTDLNAASPGGATLHGIAANFEPSGTMRQVFRDRMQDAVVDRLMADTPNDMVVPTAGVSGNDVDPAALVADPLVFDVGDGVHHSNLWQHPRVLEALATWLALPAAP